MARTVLIFLGIPLAAGFLTRRIGLKRKGREWYDQEFIPGSGRSTLYGLLFTIVLLFAIQGDTITSQPLDVARIALPLLVYFVLMWLAEFVIGKSSDSHHRRRASHSPSPPTTSSLRSRLPSESSAPPRPGPRRSRGTLIEVPVLVALVYVALWARRFWAERPAGATAVAWPGSAVICWSLGR